MLIIRTLITFLRDKEYQSLLISTGLIIGLGSLVYHFLEGWSYIDALYFSVITLTTIGFGDFTPQTVEGKIFTIFYIFIGIGIILTFVNTVYNHYNKMRVKGKHKDK